MTNLPQFSQSSVALGFFDGVHHGHIAVIRAAAAHRTADRPCVVVTFDRPPSNHPAPMLMTRRMKEQVMESLGVDVLVRLDFNLVHDLDPQQFVEDFLKKRLHATQAACGFNYRFGRDAQGDTDELARLCKAAGCRVHVVQPIEQDGVPVSSTWVRKALTDGDTELAARLLGRPFGFDFSVVLGDQRGATLGFPTVNQLWPEAFIQPLRGVYIAQATVDGRVFPAVTNFGIRPTIGTGGLQAETHILGFSGNLYGQNPQIGLWKYLRPEQQFDSLDALRQAMRHDADHALAYIAQKQK